TRSSRRAAYESKAGRRAFAEVRTTAQIADTVRCDTADRRINHSVTNAQALQLPTRELLVPPYTLGAWLGDGTSAAAQITSIDPEIIACIEAEDIVAVPSQSAQGRFQLELPAVSAPVPPPVCAQCGGPSIGLRLCPSCRNAVGSVEALLRTLGVLGDKHIPVEYLRASEAQRRALLAGLLDTDGTVTHGGSVRFTATDERLLRDVQELAVSLGYHCDVSTERVRGSSEQSSTCYILTFATDDEVFRLYRKALLHKERRAAQSTGRSNSRYIVDVRRIESVPVRCVEVDNADHLYLAGRSMVPTHNSTLGMDFMRSCSIKHGMASVIFSLEMSRTEIVMRLLSAEAKIKLGDMRSGRMSDDDWTKLARRMSEISEAPLFVDDSPNLTMMEIRAKARRLKQRHDLKLVVVDYLQLMSSGKKVESRQQEVSEFSRHLKLLAKELEVPVIAISQLNRGPEQRTDKRPMVSDLRESGSLEQDADMVILLHRPDAIERDDPRGGEADLIVGKHRNGPTATITVAHQLHLSRFVDMARG
ncbi:MAG: AAA family ATPase, partial [Nocardia sp.]|nr:AAA family ATPase [Nocardia sp.]